MQARRVLPRKSRQHEGPHDCRLEEVLLLIENPRWTPFFGIKRFRNISKTGRKAPTGRGGRRYLYSRIIFRFLL